MMNHARRFAAYGAFAVIAPIAVASAATAQQQVLRDPEQIRACVCVEQTLKRQAVELAAQRQAYEEARRQVEALDAAVEAQRPQVRVNDRASVDSFRQLLDKRNAAQVSFANQLTPRYAALVEQYNRRATEFNRACAGSSYDAEVLAKVQQGLVCPLE